MRTWWESIPEHIREPILSALFSALLGVQAVVLTMVASASIEGESQTPQALLHYFSVHWWAGLMGLILPAAYRARQKSIAVANTIQLGGGITAVVTPPKGK